MAFLYTLYEYLLIVLPVALYVLLESRGHPRVLCAMLASPEWNMATILLGFQGESIYRTHLERQTRSLPTPIIGLIMLFVLVIVVLAANNIPFALSGTSRTASMLTWVLFLLTTIAFLLFITGAHFVTAHSSEGANA
jgi:hypothetical protein